ncbi:hypothetical protein C5B91_20215 [Haloferax sp. Atlit-10N]|uniref:hypothetical protein n=1 Tax=unclassified Haloferax TaxID=2625095 RepID=UPI000E21E4D0|nr:MULTISPECIES: hypothetical protein [unclassified Haloferax]RDZ39419.1 hypothetical protein C5B87_19475 [Haloferax sp. Atlit-16N]RDZ53934.1 hypothetical protein C5B91_20215 [Haloferax sp. Atlit-10N]
MADDEQTVKLGNQKFTRRQVLAALGASGVAAAGVDAATSDSGDEVMQLGGGGLDDTFRSELYSGPSNFPPDNPSLGDIWFQTDTSKRLVWAGDGWYDPGLDTHSVSADDGFIGVTHLGHLTSTPGDSAIEADNTAIYSKPDGKLYKKPYGGAESVLSPGLNTQETDTVSGVSEIVITGLDNTFAGYEVRLFDVQLSQTAELNIQLSTDGGSSYLSGSYKWQHSNFEAGSQDAPSTGSGAADIELTKVLGAGSADSSQAKIELSHPANTATKPSVDWDVSGIADFGEVAKYEGSALWNGSATAYDTVRVFPTSGTMTATYVVQGVA